MPYTVGTRVQVYDIHSHVELDDDEYTGWVVSGTITRSRRVYEEDYEYTVRFDREIPVRDEYEEECQWVDCLSFCEDELIFVSHPERPSTTLVGVKRPKRYAGMTEEIIR